MATIPALAFTGDESHDFDRAAYFALASCFPSPLIPEIRARAAVAEIRAYPARPATALIPANPANPAILAGALFKNSPAIAAGAAVPAFPAKAATPLVPAITAITGVAGNITRVIADGSSIAPITGIDTLEKLLYYYASQSGSGATIQRVTLGGNSYFKIMREIVLAAVNSGGNN